MWRDSGLSRIEARVALVMRRIESYINIPRAMRGLWDSGMPRSAFTSSERKLAGFDGSSSPGSKPAGILKGTDSGNIFVWRTSPNFCDVPFMTAFLVPRYVNLRILQHESFRTSGHGTLYIKIQTELPMSEFQAIHHGQGPMCWSASRQGARHAYSPLVGQCTCC